MNNAFALVDDFDRRLRRIEDDVARILELLRQSRANPLESNNVHSNKKLAYTLREASETTGLSRAKFYKLFSEGKLRRSKAGGRTLVLATELERYLREVS
ncbi:MULTISPECIES: helix-turn-helix domain-containing protein [unclassified Mesorhizobium]|uniref:helix-turn-helix domain-containing protein n=1 Tax=unclassified Mesorhizobium TaxID=325217 RepID=UPI0013DED27F|nr:MULTISPECIES: helix-turn-helix domain-containing protein [unclassified Mesorhizobium]MCT2575702.1 helix-turn-helix domain-containing protein [Mesorhizobium sp. P13.3]MDF3165364.1 helix-turn-helix domain-containing protein [Mesorhizobium sp. P16.1]MDF3176998.1 helix-turn-helix domain-containing protein [Mesorhizobium sp. P17.1]MDF3182276.1 helix-turn-helix domain-containing protein [Mesorhizobium sp. ICCV3110.1]